MVAANPAAPELAQPATPQPPAMAENDGRPLAATMPAPMEAPAAALEPAPADIPVAPQIRTAAPAAAPAQPTVASQHVPPLPQPLPVQDLQSVVQAAGLQWVQSDPIRIEQAQRALRQMPAPKHVPRERKPLTVQDEGPLMLVETRKDLPSLQLPENGSGH